MLKNLISALVMVAFVVGGAFAADALKPGPKRFFAEEKAAADGDDASGEADEAEGGDAVPAAEAENHDDEESSESHGEEEKANGHGGGHGEQSKAGDTTFYKFSRQFIVPVVNGDDVASLVILDLNLELEPRYAEDAYALEPKIRDSLMTELLALSNEGRFERRLTDPKNYSEIRARLLAAAHAVMSDGVHDVLILDMARQDQ